MKRVEILWSSFSNYSSFFFFRFGRLETFIRKILKSNFRPGQHRTRYNKKPTQFFIRLRQKQKLRIYYSVSESQLIKYMKKARKVIDSTSQVLTQLLEIRLDVIIYRIKWAPTILTARQIVNHSYIFVNGKQTIGSNCIYYRTDRLLKKIISCQPGITIQNFFTYVDPTSYKTGIKFSYFNPMSVIEYYSNRLLFLFLYLCLE